MLTYKQDKRYWRTWGAICKAQGWNKESAAKKDERRHALHKGLGLPDHHMSWHNSQFSRFLSQTAHLMNQVDIRDRDRENAVWTIERLQEAFKVLLGHDYARILMIDFRDSTDLDKFPLIDPLQYMRDDHGRRDPRDADKLRDLVNLRNTLKNRIGRVIQRIKDGQIQPGPDCPNFYDRPQDEIITALVQRVPITPRPAVTVIPAPKPQPARSTKRQYALDGGKTFNPQRTKPAAPVNAPETPTGTSPIGAAVMGEMPEMPAPADDPGDDERVYCMHDLPPAPKPAKPASAPAPEPEDETMPF